MGGHIAAHFLMGWNLRRFLLGRGFDCSAGCIGGFAVKEQQPSLIRLILDARELLERMEGQAKERP